MSCDSVQIKYIGDGSTTLFTFPFEYERQADVVVGIWDQPTLRYVPTTEYTFENATTIRFNTAPAVDADRSDNILIARVTNIDEMLAVFYPGSSIRAQDLNDDFEQLRMAIQEGRCGIEDLYKYIDRYFWNKNEETIYTSDDWVADDDHIATTGAIQGQLDKNVDKSDVISRKDQTDGNWLKDGDLDDDDHLASAAAISERHDPFFQPNQPTPVPTFRIPGRRWFDNDDARDMVWDQSVQTWVDATNAGPVGPQGPEGTFSTIVSDDAPTVRNNGQALQNGDVWFNSQIGESFVWYMDGTSNQWVSISPAGPQGPQGIEGPQGPGGDAQTVIVSDHPPALNVNGEPVVNGDLWFNSANGILFTRYDGTWVSTSLVGPPGPPGQDGAAGPGGGIPEAPIDGEIYGRQNGNWVTGVVTGANLVEPLQLTAGGQVQINLQILNAIL